MADKKISQLATATTPLAGTEVVPIVQGGSTVKVPVSDLTAGRAVSASSVTASTGSFVVSTAGQGVNFSANAHAAGMTSELLNWYEEGTWTPAVTGWTGITYIDQTGFYNRVGRQVTCWFYIRLTGTSAASAVTITGLPFSANTKSNGGALTYYDVAVNRDGILINPSGTTIRFYADADTGATVNSDGNVTDKYLVGSVTYIV